MRPIRQIVHGNEPGLGVPDFYHAPIAVGRSVSNSRAVGSYRLPLSPPAATPGCVLGTHVAGRNRYWPRPSRFTPTAVAHGHSFLTRKRRGQCGFNWRARHTIGQHCRRVARINPLVESGAEKVVSGHFFALNFPQVSMDVVLICWDFSISQISQNSVKVRFLGVLQRRLCRLFRLPLLKPFLRQFF